MKEHPRPSHAWWLYVIRTKAGTLYTGITTDVARRFGEHAAGRSRAARYLRGHKPDAIVLRKRIGPKSLAAKVEYHFKRLDRARKEAIVASRRLAYNKRTGLPRPPAYSYRSASMGSRRDALRAG